MKVLHLFVLIFAVFAFLTIGSLMIIISLHVLTMEDALLQVQDLYENPWQSFKMGASGILFIFVGILFSKMLVKETRSDNDMVLRGQWGYLTVSLKAVEDVARKGLRKFQEICDAKVKVEVRGNHLKILIGLSVLAGLDLQEFTRLVQGEVLRKMKHLVGEGFEIEMVVNVTGIVEPEAAVPVA